VLQILGHGCVTNNKALFWSIL